MSAGAIDAVRKYYDDNTAAFERFGQGRATLHRAVWGPGVRTRPEAFAYLDQRIQEQLARRFSPEMEPRVLDLGCGLGASLLRLAARRGLHGVGVTISPLQVERANSLISEAGLSDRLRVLERSFTDLREDIGEFDAAFAIESFVHSPSPQAFFEPVAGRLRPGGVLVLIDDFLTTRGALAPGARARKLLGDFRECWLANSAVPDATAEEAARAHGLSCVHNEDLTSYLELRRPRDRAIALLVRLGAGLPIRGERWRAWKGGSALQLALVEGLVSFRFMVFEKRRQDHARSYGSSHT